MPEGEYDGQVIRVGDGRSSTYHVWKACKTCGGWRWVQRKYPLPKNCQTCNRKQVRPVMIPRGLLLP